jgi:TonB family protein
MKKREITNEELEQLFNTIIEQKPLINEEQVHSFLYNLPNASSVNAIKQFFQNHLNTLIFGTIVLSIVVGVALWGNSSHKTEKPVAQNIRQENELAPASNDTIVVAPAVDIIKKVVQDTVTEDTSLKTTSSEMSQTDTILSVSDIYKRFDKTPQLFFIQANRDTTIICKEGTSIKIKANTLISERTGNEISGKVQLAVKEYYKLSDIILSNLTTTSGNKILETGGMLHLAATADSENCMIKQGCNIEIGFPYSDKKEDMKLFNGTWTNDKIDWELTNTAQDTIRVFEKVPEEALEPAWIIVEEPAEYPGGYEMSRKYIEENAQYPFLALKDKIEGTVYVQFTIDKDGNVRDIKVLRGLGNILDKVSVYIISKMPVWKPAKQGGRPVNQQFVWPINFALRDTVFTKEEILQSKALDEKIKDIKVNNRRSNSISNNEDLRAEFEKKVNDDSLKETTVSDVNRYVFSASRLGWINCDRFSKYSSNRTNYSIRIDQADQAIVTLIFQRFKSILPGYVESNRIVFTNVPIGEKVMIVAVKMVNNKLFLAVKETEISNKVETDLDFKPISMALLKKEIEKLNKDN